MPAVDSRTAILFVHTHTLIREGVDVSREGYLDPSTFVLAGLCAFHLALFVLGQRGRGKK